MTTLYYADWHDVPDKLWRWANFSPEEIACRGDGTIRINEAALDRLQALRDQLGVPMIVHSAYRSPSYNRRVGRAKHSMHLQGAAFDISMANHDPKTFEAAAIAVGFTGFGYYPRQTFMHIDTGRTRQWGDPFLPRLNRSALAVGKWAAIALTISLFLLSLRRAGERAGRLAEQLENQEKANEIQRRMLEAAARRPRDRDELAERLHNGQF